MKHTEVLCYINNCYNKYQQMYIGVSQVSAWIYKAISSTKCGIQNINMGATSQI